MLRIGLFLLTNLAIMIVAGVVINLLGVGKFISHGQLNLQSLFIFCAVFGFTGSFISLFISKWMAKRSMGVELIENPRNADERWLVDTVAELAQKAGIKMPEVGVFPAEESNAFATGWNRNDALVAVSLGLLQRFERDEVRAVLAHEIGHVANGDMVTLSLIQGIVNTFVMFFARIVGFAIDKALQGGRDNESSGPGIGYYVGSFVAEIIFGILASMIVAAFSRYREYRADEAGAHLADRNAMIRALQRLQLESGQTSMPASMQAFGIAGGMGRLFASHPPLEERIQALRNGHNNPDSLRQSLS
ncbi:protease HtpX [Cellvibrio zantedeschiae]|uniref:Protease HtpX n=1 Tax=Cellvibrio zantedeschiae TaxID=1237077 RepID=A0ABQ3B8A6_9GAMM|nr:protease HtpX [Cellvibrio zantedeschiae]GGY80123.1 protease HtpX [Cellvibrio zantedeschiae]